MTQKMLIDATHAEETRVVVVDGNKVEEFDFESLNKRQLAGNIYLAKVTRVEPSLQAAFVEYGGNRHGFLAFSEIHPDYYQIPKADRDALLAEEAEMAREAEEEAPRERPKSRGRSRSRRRSEPAAEGLGNDPTVYSETIDAGGETYEDADAAPRADDPMPVIDVAPARDFDDAPPPSAAAGDIEIDVPDEPDDQTEAGAAGDFDGETDDEVVAAATDDAGPASRTQGDYESVGGDDVAEERAPRKARPRRYKIQEVVKVRQIMLVQVVKEERGNKGAALTTYLSLAGRYCVLMPNTARGGGISRKITNAADRKKLKEISNSIIVPQGAGLIIRTAGANRTKTEIKRDYEYLLRQWEQIRELTLRSIAPAPIYEEGSLIKRAIRDLYSREIDEILVDGDRGYREAKDYMKMLMPSHAKNVQHYTDPLPLFSRFQVESYLGAMFNPVVQLKSGGYIVIDVTEALVAIDVNSGRATREASIEDTALKTNLEAAEEAARQMRLRDLAGLIVIDFIDMEDRKNNAAVEKRLKEKLKSDRARIQIGRISGFGLLEMSRQRLRPGMIEATTKACAHCHGTGRVRSDDSMALALLRELEEEGVRQRSKEVLLVVPVEIANYLLNHKREHIAMIESRFGLSVRVEGHAAMISPDYRVERFKTASRIIPAAEATVLPTVAYPDEDEIETDVEEASEETEAPEDRAADGEAAADRSNGKRRRRRRRRGGAGRAEDETRPEAGDAEGETPDPAVETPVAAESVAIAAAPAEELGQEPKPKSRRRSRGGRSAKETQGQGEDAAAQEPAPVIETHAETDAETDAPDIVPVPEADAPQRRSRPRVRVPVEAVLVAEPTEDAGAESPVAGGEPEPEMEPAPEPAAEENRVAATEPEEAMAGAEAAPAPAPQQQSEPKRRGWWSRALGGS
jgi:ribonuclease E